MQALNEPLTELELDELDRILLERISEDADTADRDEGIIGLSELDGFLTAVVSGPVMIPPSQWMSAVWGEFEPVWDSVEEAERTMQLMLRHMNGISGTLMQAPEKFEPIFLEGVEDGESRTVVDEWCEGYARGVRLDVNAWQSGGDDIGLMLMPILSFTGASEWAGHKGTPDEIKGLQDAVVRCTREIHAYWLERRHDVVAPPRPVRRENPRVGRNDPCPCGSGKKYKKCCLQ